MAAASSGTLPRDPRHRVSELRAQGHTGRKLRDQLRADGYPEHVVRGVVPGHLERGETASTPVDPAPSSPAPEAKPDTGDTGDDTETQDRPAGGTRTMPSLSLPSGGNAAGAVLGVIGMAVVVNYMRGGPDQVKAWARAKFLNDAAAYNSPSTVGHPGVGAANIYNVHAAMTRQAYNAAHPTGGGTSTKGGPTR